MAGITAEYQGFNDSRENKELGKISSEKMACICHLAVAKTAQF